MVANMNNLYLYSEDKIDTFTCVSLFGCCVSSRYKRIGIIGAIMVVRSMAKKRCAIL